MAKNEVSNEIAIGLTLLSRTYCHLCHDMEEALAPIAAEFGAAVEVLDVDNTLGTLVAPRFWSAQPRVAGASVGNRQMVNP